MSNIKSTVAGSCIFIFLVFANAYAVEFHSHDSIKKSVTDFLKLDIEENKQYEIEVGSIDSRLKLIKCNSPLEISRAMGQKRFGRITVGVKCKGDSPWSLYLPVSLKVYERVLVVNRSLPAGSMIRAEDLSGVEKDVSSLARGYFLNPEEVVGSFVKRPLANGTVLTAANIRPPNIAERGERVIILAKGDGVVVRMQGQVMSNAVAGDRVQVKNLISNRIVEGRIYKKGVVEVAM